MRGKSYLAMLGAAVGALSATANLGTAAPNLQCGSSVSASTVLTHDIVNCPGDGLIIEADGVVLNLAGHRLSGTGNGIGIFSPDFRGNITIKNGSVSGFLHGVTILGATQG